MCVWRQVLSDNMEMRFFCPKKAKFYLKLSQLKGESCAVVLFYLFFWASVTGTVVGTVWFGGNFGLVSLLIFSFEMARALSTFQHVLRPLGGPPPQKKTKRMKHVLWRGKNAHFLFCLMLLAPGPCKATRHCTLALRHFTARGFVTAVVFSWRFLWLRTFSWLFKSRMFTRF